MRSIFVGLVVVGLVMCGCGGDSAGDLEPTKATPSSTVLAVRSLVAPYADKADVDWIGSYSGSANTPLGRDHNGIDFLTTGDRKPFRAVGSGTISQVKLWQLDNGNWQVSVRLEMNGGMALYAFEPMTANQSDGQAQLDAMTAAEGDFVPQGDVIGYLHEGDARSTHVHFGIYIDNQTFCPETYFKEADRAEMASMTLQGEPLCY